MKPVKQRKPSSFETRGMALLNIYLNIDHRQSMMAKLSTALRRLQWFALSHNKALFLLIKSQGTQVFVGRKPAAGDDR